MDLAVAFALGLTSGALIGTFAARAAAAARARREQRELEESLSRERIERARAEERAQSAETSFGRSEALLAKEREARSAAEREREAALARATEEGKRVEQVKEELKLAREELKNAFHALSKEVLRIETNEFLERAKETFGQTTKEAKVHMEQLVAPLKENLDKLDKASKELETKREGAYQALRQTLTTLGDQTQRLHEQTMALSTSLRGSSQRRGTWGETQLRNVVELAGLVKHCDFLEQESVAGLRPDLVVRLPGERRIAVDAKAPLTAYLDACEAPDDASRREALKRYASDVRSHVKALASREYHERLGDSADFVVLFLPNDGFLAAVFEQDRDVFDFAIRNKVLISTPVTLVALLKTVALSWHQDALAENAERIGAEARELYNRIVNFTEPLGTVGKELEGAVRAYNKAVGSFEGRLLPHVRRMEELSGSDAGRKELPPLTQVESALRLPKPTE